LALKRSGHKIQELVDNNSWIPFKFGWAISLHVPRISFSNNFILVAEANLCDQTMPIYYMV